MTVLLAALVSASFMAGLSWFVGVVHYPLFDGVGAAGWTAYHRRHSDRTAVVVVAPMVVELGAATWIVAARPDQVSPGLAAMGLAVAVGAWLLTAAAARLHRRLGGGLDPRAHHALLATHHARTVLWTAHAAVGVLMVAAAAG